jgi:hypothetical protein
MRLQRNFAAQVPRHLFEGLDKIITDARTFGTSSF